MNTPSLPPRSLPSSSNLSAEQVADYLLAHRDFFEQQPTLLSRLTLPAVVGENTISLQAKQVNALRAQVEMHENQLATLLGNAQNSDTIAQGLHTIAQCLLAQRTVSGLPLAGQEAIGHVFGLQDTALRLWGTEPLYAKMPCNEAVNDDVKTFADGLKQPYCGPNANFSAMRWLQRDVASVALVALRVTPNSRAFGLLVIGSQDPLHFTRDKSTDLLAQLGQIFSASLGRMLPPFS